MLTTADTADLEGARRRYEGGDLAECVVLLLPLARAAARAFNDRDPDDLEAEAAYKITRLVYKGRQVKFSAAWWLRVCTNACFDAIRRRRRFGQRAVSLEEYMERRDAPQGVIGYAQVPHLDTQFFLKYERNALLRRWAMQRVRFDGQDRAVVAYLLDRILDGAEVRPVFLQGTVAPVRFLIDYTKLIYRMSLYRLRHEYRPAVG